MQRGTILEYRLYTPTHFLRIAEKSASRRKVCVSQKQLDVIQPRLDFQFRHKRLPSYTDIICSIQNRRSPTLGREDLARDSSKLKTQITVGTRKTPHCSPARGHKDLLHSNQHT